MLLADICYAWYILYTCWRGNSRHSTMFEAIVEDKHLEYAVEEKGTVSV